MKREVNIKQFLITLSFLVCIMLGLSLLGIFGKTFWSIVEPMEESRLRSLLEPFSIVILLFLMPVSIYIGDCLWLLLWRNFATQDDIKELVSFGPTTKFDRWLIKKLGPKK